MVPMMLFVVSRDSEPDRRLIYYSTTFLKLPVVGLGKPRPTPRLLTFNQNGSKSPPNSLCRCQTSQARVCTGLKLAQPRAIVHFPYTQTFAMSYESDLSPDTMSLQPILILPEFLCSDGVTTRLRRSHPWLINSQRVPNLK